MISFDFGPLELSWIYWAIIDLPSVFDALPPPRGAKKADAPYKTPDAAEVHVRG
jgi:hypothetical protein